MLLSKSNRVSLQNNEMEEALGKEKGAIKEEMNHGDSQ